MVMPITGTGSEDDLENLDDLNPEDEDLDTPEGDENIVDEDVENQSPEGEDGEDHSTEDESPKRQVAQLKAQIKELNSRIGSLAQANDTRVREVEQQWTAWGESYRQWAEDQIAEARRLGREEAEEHFLPMLGPEEKAEYLDQTRAQARSAREREKQNRAAAAAAEQSRRAELSTAIARAQQSGVPLEALNTSTPETVTESAMRYLASKGPAPKGGEGEGETLADLKRRLDEQDALIKRMRRDSTGASRTGTGTGTSPANTRLREVDQEIDDAKRRHDISGLLRLKREREALLAGARK